MKVLGNLCGPAKDILVGAEISSIRVFTKELVDQYASLSLDYNPIHFEINSNRPLVHKHTKPLVHGMLYAGMFGSMFAKKLPGAIYREQTLVFKQPVFIDDVLLASIKVEQIKRRGITSILKCDTKIFKKNCAKDAHLVLDGSAKVLIFE